MSFSAWIKKDDTTGNERIINQNDTIFYVEVQTQVVQFRHLNVGDGATATGNVITSAGRWYLVTATYDGVYTTVYVDGALVAQESSTGNFGTFSGTPYIGKSSASADRFFDGSIDDVRIYNRALSPREVRDLYAFAPGPVGRAIRQVKSLQEYLGLFNDRSVQQQFLFDHLKSIPAPHGPRRMAQASAVGALIGVLFMEKAHQRAGFEEVYTRFSDPEQVRSLRKIFSPE